MKKFIIFIFLLLFPWNSFATTTVSVCNMTSSAPVQVRIYDITDVAEDVAWTNTGVTERAVGLSKSCYRYAATLETGHSYQIDWRDSGTPTKVASETVYEIQTALPQVATVTGNVNGSVGSVTGAVGSVTGAVGSVTGAVTVGTNNDKIGYTVSTVQDKTGYSLTQSFPANFSSLAITAGGAVTAGTVSDKTGYSLTQSFPTNFASLAITVGGAVTAGTVSDKTGYSLSVTPPTAADIRTEMDTNSTKLANLDATVSSRSTFAGGAVASVTGAVGSVTDPVTVGTNNDKTGYSLTQSFPTNFASLAVTIGGAVTAGTVSDKTGYSLSVTPPTAVQIRTEMDTNSTKLLNLDATITSRLASASYTAPDNTSIGTILSDIQNVTYGLNALLTAINTRLATSGYTVPDNAGVASILANVEHATYGLNALLTAVNTRLAGDAYVSPDNSGSVLSILDTILKLDEMLELDGALYRYTANALEQAPSGGGGVSDWTTGEKEQIRDALGVGGTKTAAAGGQIQAIKAKTDNLPADPASNTQVNTRLASADAITPADLFDFNISAYVGAGLAGTYLKNAGAAGNPWSELIPGVFTAGQAGYVLGHGPDVWGKFVIPVQTANVYNAITTQTRGVIVMKGDSPDIPIALTTDWSGWTPWFAMKKLVGDTAYIVSPKQCTWTDATAGTGTCSLTTTETNLAAVKYYGEIEMRKGVLKVTPIRFSVTITEDVID